MLNPKILPLLFSLIVLLGFNVLAILSQSPGLIWKQLLSWFLALILFFIGKQIVPRHSEGIKNYLLIGCSLFILIPILTNNITRGSRRWIDIGPQRIQPSEVAKPLLMLYLANSTSPFLLIIPVLFILMQPDLGSAMTTAVLGAPFIFFNPKVLKIVLALGFVFLLVSPFIWKFALHDYQRNRITYFINPNLDPLNKGYNLIQSKIAIGSGGIWGRGFRQGSQGRLSFLPEKHTDFVFASIAEEFGFSAVILLLLAYYFLLRYLFNLAFRSPYQQSKIYTMGIAFLIWFQAFVNIGMNLGVMPVTGITLPFVSYGGSSLMALGFALGIIHSS